MAIMPETSVRHSLHVNDSDPILRAKQALDRVEQAPALDANAVPVERPSGFLRAAVLAGRFALALWFLATGSSLLWTVPMTIQTVSAFLVTSVAGGWLVGTAIGNFGGFPPRGRHRRARK